MHFQIKQCNFFKMDTSNLLSKIEQEQSLDKEAALVLLSENIDTIDLLSTAYKLRKKY